MLHFFYIKAVNCQLFHSFTPFLSNTTPLNQHLLQSTKAEVNIDIGHTKGTPAPAAPHIGWQTPGKRSDGAIRGHIFVPDVPVNR